MTRIISKNRESFTEYRNSINSFEVFRGKESGKLYGVVNMDFEQRVYISPAASELLEKKGADAASELQYAEVSIDNGATFVPTLMVIGNRPKAVLTL